MKRIFLISLLFPLLVTGCLYYEEAETVNPDDETYYNPVTPPGNVTSLTATITGPSLTNKVIMIEFDSPASAGSIVYDTSITVYLDGTPLSEGVSYDAYPDPVSEAASAISLTITTALTAGNVVTVTLTSGITADSDNSVTLTPQTQNYTL